MRTASGRSPRRIPVTFSPEPRHGDRHCYSASIYIPSVNCTCEPVEPGMDRSRRPEADDYRLPSGSTFSDLTKISPAIMSGGGVRTRAADFGGITIMPKGSCRRITRQIGVVCYLIHMPRACHPICLMAILQISLCKNLIDKYRLSCRPVVSAPHRASIRQVPCPMHGSGRLMVLSYQSC